MQVRSFLIPAALILLAPVALFAMRAGDAPSPSKLGGPSGARADDVAAPSASSSPPQEAPMTGDSAPLLGVLLPRDAVDVSAREIGTVVAVNVRIGDHVKKGDVLVSLDARLAASDLASARAAVKSQKVDIEVARAASSAAAEHEARILALAKEGLASGEQVAEASRDRKLGALRVEGARAALAEKKAHALLRNHEKDLKTVRAPFDGTIVARYVDSGTTVAATPPKPLVRIISTEGVFVRFAVSEKRIATLRLGARVRIQPRGMATSLPGTVERIAPEVDPSTRIAFAEAAFDEPLDTLVAGVAADVTPIAD